MADAETKKTVSSTVSRFSDIAQKNAHLFFIATVVLTVIVLILVLYYNGYIGSVHANKTTDPKESSDTEHKIEQLMNDINEEQTKSMSEDRD